MIPNNDTNDETGTLKVSLTIIILKNDSPFIL